MLAGQRETTHREQRKRTETDLELSFWLCCSSNTYLLILLPQLHIRCRLLFRAHLNIGLIIFVSLHCLWLVFNLSLLHISEPTNFQTQVVPLLPPGVGERNTSISGGFKPVQKIIFNYNSHSLRAHWLTSALASLLRSAGTAFSYFFSSLSQKLTSHSNFDSP